MMTNNHEINGKKMDQEDATIRDEKGRFTSGTHGGPGRGKSEARAKSLAEVDGFPTTRFLKKNLTLSFWKF